MFRTRIAFQWIEGVRGPECERPRDPFFPENDMEQNSRESLLLAVLILFAALFVSACGGGDNNATPAANADACITGPASTPVDTPFCRGNANFHDRTLAGLGGNGRAWAIPFL